MIALSQLSRSVEQRGGDKRPVLSDLRESGAIEQDADIVSFIYRPEYYGLMDDGEGGSNAGIGEIIVAKHRNGSLDTVRLRFIGQYARFENLDNMDANFGNSTIGSAMNSNKAIESAAANAFNIPSKINVINEKDGEDFSSSSDIENAF